MKKEKQVRSYKRRTKSGKIVTVKAHTAKYEAADDEKAKEVSKKPGAGKELEERKKKAPVQLEIPFGKEEEKKVLDDVKGEEKKSSKKSSEKPAEKKTTKKVRPVGSGTNGPTPKKSDSPFMKGERKSDRGTYFSTDTLDKEYKNVMSAIKTGDIKQINKARSKYSAIYSHHGDHFEDKKSEAYRKRQTDSIEKKMNALGYDYWGKPLKKNAVNPTGSTKATKTSTKTTVKSTTSEPAFTAAEFKEWYHGTGSAADKKVAKTLRAQLGRSGYRKLEDEAIDNYSSRGHLSMFKRVGGGSSASTSKPSTGTSVKKVATKKTKSSDLSTHEGQMSYIRSRVKELPEESRKRLNTFLRRASTGVISTTDLWRKYQRGKISKE